MGERKEKKQVPLRISGELYAELEEWAEADFRSVNGEIEYLLTECVKYRRRKGGELANSAIKPEGNGGGA